MCYRLRPLKEGLIDPSFKSKDDIPVVFLTETHLEMDELMSEAHMTPANEKSCQTDDLTDEAVVPGPELASKTLGKHARFS